MDELLHLDHVEKEVTAGNLEYAYRELEELLPIIRRAIESGETDELETWAR